MIKTLLPLCAIIALSACGTLDSIFNPEEKKLEGERLSLYEFEKTLQSDKNTQFGVDGTENKEAILNIADITTDSSLELSPVWTNKFWPQVGGYANHAMKHLAFSPEISKRLWRSDIGEGGSERLPLTTSPIVADGKIFVQNNDAEVIAFDMDTGDDIWEQSVLKPGEDEIVIGGGLAFSGGRVFVTNGFNEVVALDSKTGKTLWRTGTKAPVRAAPSAIPNRVFVTTLDNETLAINATNGEILWAHRGLTNDAGVLGAATPAIARNTVITAYGSGEIYALQMDTGAELWSKNLSPIARTAGRSQITDIRALPVVDSGVVYAASLTNRMVAIDLRTGETKWEIPMGALTTPWVSGNRLFAIETQGTLVSIDRADGKILWQTDLNTLTEDRMSWTGPYITDNNILLFGSEDTMMAISPQTGEVKGQKDIDDDVYLNPAIANNTLFLLSNDGDLTAWR